MSSSGTACFSRGQFADPTLVDNAIVLDNTGLAGSQARLTTLIGTAQAGSAGSAGASYARMAHYDLLFFRNGRPGLSPLTFDAGSDAPLFGYRVSARAVGWDESGPGKDDGTPGNLLLGGAITLDWGAYWLVLVTVPVCGASYNNGLGDYVVWPTSVADGVLWPFTLSDPTVLNGMTPSGLPGLAIANSHVLGFRINRRDWV